MIFPKESFLGADVMEKNQGGTRGQFPRGQFPRGGAVPKGRGSSKGGGAVPKGGSSQGGSAPRENSKGHFTYLNMVISGGGHESRRFESLDSLTLVPNG